MLGWLKGVLKLLIIVPVAAVAVLLAVANRNVVTLVLDPFSRETPGLAVSMPLFALLFGAIGLGVLLGGVGAWLAQGEHRRQERLFRREAEQLRVDVARFKQQAGATPALDRKAA